MYRPRRVVWHHLNGGQSQTGDARGRALEGVWHHLNGGQSQTDRSYFRITTSSTPLRRSTFTPTSPSSCLVSRRSTRASPSFRSRILTSGRNAGKTGFENMTVCSGADTLKPRQASSKRKTAPDAQACGLQATG